MNIFIDIHRAIGADGKAIAYCPEVHWQLDDCDNVSISMDELKMEIQELVQKKLAGVKDDD